MKFEINILKYAEEFGEETPDWSQNGQSKKVYLVPIDKIYYNDDNGRIATWISSYSDDTYNKPLNSLELEEYNRIIHDFVKKSNSSDSFKKTLSDIELKGQIRPGVILADGRVVSGNRRLTVLRELYNTTGNDKFKYFKCFIEDKDLSDAEDRKYIKTIERLTQFGVDEKVDYDPIDRLVDIYNDLIGPNKIWGIKEYTKKLSLKTADVEKMRLKAEIMADYLNYINKPYKFYIAKDLKLDGPLQELVRTSKNSSVEEWNRIRVAFYSLFQEKGDTTRQTRNLNKIYKQDLKEFNRILYKFVSDIEDAETNLSYDAEKVPEFVLPKVSNDTKNEIIDAANKAKIEEKRYEKVKKIFNSLQVLTNELLDTENLMTPEEKNRLNSNLTRLDHLFKKVRGIEN
jgi:hypothetical protein